MSGGLPPLVALLGNPNSGKTTLFNRLTGLTARTGNYPGITVEHREGRATFGAVEGEVIDLPGTYSLVPRAEDEAVAVRAAFGTLAGSRPPDLCVVVCDVTHLERNLYLAAEAIDLGLPCLVALTMTDTLADDGGAVDVEGLSKRLGVPVVRSSGRRPDEVAALRQAIERALAAPPAGADEEAGAEPKQASAEGPKRSPDATARADEAPGSLAARLRSGLHLAHASAAQLESWARAAGAAGAAPRLGLTDGLVAELERDSLDNPARWTAERYRRVEDIVAATLTPAGTAPSELRTDRIDRWVLHPVAGPLLLLVVFGALFQALFSWSAPFMDWIEEAVGATGALLADFVPRDLPLFRSLLLDGLVAGVGNVLVFIPQIAALFFFLAVLEDSGYLARAAFLLDRAMARVGLHGRAFVPMLSGFACAVPALMATRTIESEKDRLVTILVTPLVSCSARLPVYTLVIATVFSDTAPLFGWLEVGTVLMFSMYGLGIAAAVTMAFVFKRTLLRSPTPALVLELPPYRMPQLGGVLRPVADRVKVFLTDAGTVILAVTIVLWGLFTFPRSDEVEHDRQAALDALSAQTLDGDQRAEAEAAIEQHAAATRVEKSAGGRLGKVLEPVLEPLGYDWKMGVGILASFAAREVLVSTLGLVYGLGDGSDEESVPLREALRHDRRPDGRKVFTPAAGLSLMIFFLLAMQCMSTLAAVKRETRSWRWPLFQLGYMTVLAYVAALVTYQVAAAVGLA